MIYLFMVLGAVMIFAVFILPIIQKGTDYTKDIVQENKMKSEQNRIARRISNEANQRKNQHIEKKKSFKYLSNEHLLEMYNSNNSLNPMEQLALEETLVDRKLIDFSPTHEKMQRMEKHFKDKKEKQYQRTSENELSEFASSLSFIIKNHNSSQQEKISKMITDLSENIFYSSFRDIDKIPIDFSTISNPLNFKQEPNQAKYYAIWKSIKDTIIELPKHSEIINEKYDKKECLPMIKNLIQNSSEQIKKIE
ncbi:MAG: hypothetical protein ACK5MD_10470 [Flavobacteriales bacterium]